MHYAPVVTPLQFEPVLKEKIWGGTALGSVLNKRVPLHGVVGESWELSGVAGNVSMATTAPYAGKSLTEILADKQDAIVGNIPRNKGFPLLYKFIDAHDRLSVQVHPDDAQAKAHKWGNFGKTECWYIIDVQPGAQIICGFKNGVGRDDIRDAAASEKIVSFLNFMDVAAGDVILVPARTVHAVLGGVLFYEVQETADTTFRLYDWNRLDITGKPRRLHVKESLEIVDTALHGHCKIQPVVFEKTGGLTCSLRAACRHFALEEYLFSSAADVSLPAKRSFRVMTVCKGQVRIIYGNASLALRKGDTVLIPACLSTLRVAAEAGSAFLLSYVPDLASEVVTPLSEKGVSREAIVRLGGNPATSDLAPLI